MIGILSLSVDYLETLKNIYDIVDPSSLHRELTSALVQVEHGATLTAIEAQEPTA